MFPSYHATEPQSSILGLSSFELEWLISDTIFATSFFSLFFLVFRRLYHPPTLADRQRGTSWCITTTNAFFMLILSFQYAKNFIFESFSPSLIWTDHRITRFTLTAFAVSLGLDLLFGCLFYPQHINFLSGWMHHILYLVLLAYLLSERVSCALMPALFEELPTFILGVGSMFPVFRNDIAFGVTFFLLRIVFHTIFSMRVIISNNNMDHPAASSAAVACCATLLLHCYWFFGWCKRITVYSKGRNPRLSLN
eukprot:gene5501-162_t